MTIGLKPLTPAGQPVTMTGGVPNGIPTIEFWQWLNFINKQAISSSSLFINVKDAPYGAVGDGTVDDTAAIQAAINAAQAAGGGIIFVPTGIYKITTALSVSGVPVSVLGAGTQASTLLPSIGINCINFSISANRSLFCKDFSISYPSAATPGTSAITLTCSVSNTTVGCLFDNLAIAAADTCISIDKSEFFTVRACFFNTFGSTGVFIQNNFSHDEGDFSIDGNVFSTIAGYCIRLRGVGGSRIINNKLSMAGACLGGILFELVSGQSSSLAMIMGNSIEGIGGASGNAFGIEFIRLGATGVFTNLTISNNEFEAFSSGFVECIYIPTDANGSWVTNLNVSNNIFTGAGGSYLAFVDINDTSIFSIMGNVGNFSGGAATSYMVVARSSADRGVIGPNIHTNGINASLITSTNTTTITPT